MDCSLSVYTVVIDLLTEEEFLISKHAQCKHLENACWLPKPSSKTLCNTNVRASVDQHIEMLGTLK